MAIPDPHSAASEGSRIDLNQAAGPIDAPLAKLTLVYTDAGPVLTATGGDFIPTPIAVMDDAGHTVALYTAGPAAQTRTSGSMTRWQMRK